MSEAICGLLSELEEMGWHVDYAQFTGRVVVVMLPFSEVWGRFVFNTDTDYLGVSFEVDTACVTNAHVETFVTHLRHRVSAREEMTFVSKHPGKCEIGWSIHRPGLFESRDETTYAAAFWVQFERCRLFVLSYMAILEILGARPKLKLSGPINKIEDVGTLVTLCLFEQPEGEPVH